MVQHLCCRRCRLFIDMSTELAYGLIQWKYPAYRRPPNQIRFGVIQFTPKFSLIMTFIVNRIPNVLIKKKNSLLHCLKFHPIYIWGHLFNPHLCPMEQQKITKISTTKQQEVTLLQTPTDIVVNVNVEHLIYQIKPFLFREKATKFVY